MIVRDADSRPYTPDLVRPLAEHLEMPDLIRVGDRQAFPRIPVSVFGNQLSDQPDRFACRRATLQSYLFQFFDHEHPFLVLQLFAPGDGRFADTQLFFVEARIGGVQELVGRAGFRYRSFQFHIRAVGRIFGVHAAVIDGDCRVALVACRRDDLHPGAIVPVAGVTGHDRTVGRCFLADQDACTTFRSVDRSGVFDFLGPKAVPVTDKYNKKDN